MPTASSHGGIHLAAHADDQISLQNLTGGSPPDSPVEPLSEPRRIPQGNWLVRELRDLGSSAIVFSSWLVLLAPLATSCLLQTRSNVSLRWLAFFTAFIFLPNHIILRAYPWERGLLSSWYRPRILDPSRVQFWISYSMGLIANGYVGCIYLVFKTSGAAAIVGAVAAITGSDGLGGIGNKDAAYSATNLPTGQVSAEQETGAINWVGAVGLFLAVQPLTLGTIYILAPQVRSHIRHAFSDRD